MLMLVFHVKAIKHIIMPFLLIKLNEIHEYIPRVVQSKTHRQQIFWPITPESSFLSGATFCTSHIIKASVAPPLANEAACQNAGDALGGCIPTAASALMNVTLGRTPRCNNNVGPGGFALILARFFTFIITEVRVPDEPAGPILQLKPQTNVTEL